MKANLSRSDQFKIVWQFLAKHSPEVEAHSSEELSPEQKLALIRLASGKTDHTARVNLLSLLVNNRNALSFLAEQIKIARPSEKKKVAPSKTGRTRSRKSMGPR
jgi:hypothetical protein